MIFFNKSISIYLFNLHEIEPNEVHQISQIIPQLTQHGSQRIT